MEANEVPGGTNEKVGAVADRWKIFPGESMVKHQHSWRISMGIAGFELSMGQDS